MRNMEKRKFIDFTKDELVPGTLVEKFFHDRIVKIVKSLENAVLLELEDEKYSSNKKYAVFALNKDTGYWNMRISCPSVDEMHSWLSFYNKMR